jgi:1-pyrroline-5-carboxylate dehydrogenase
MSTSTEFKLTYATMFDPPEELHTQFEAALSQVKQKTGLEHAMLINGTDHFSASKLTNRSPVNADVVLGTFQRGTIDDAHRALAAAGRAYPVWSKTKWQSRVALLRKAADLMEQRIFEIAAVLTAEVGKNRMEALGDAAEAVELIRYACYQMEKNDGFVVEMGRDPLPGYRATNVSVLRPHGVWLVISPFNFPAALTAGPVGAALLTGNTVVIKPASDTPWTARLLVDALRDAGLPDGTFNYVTGPGSSIGQALVDSDQVDGITFTGSREVGMGIYRAFTKGCCPRPVILELGGKNPAIVSQNADLERAALGIVRSAFGLQGQKCSACSRIFIEEPVYDELVERIVILTNDLVVGDPAERHVQLGPVINQSAFANYQKFSEQLARAGTILTGGTVITDGALSKGWFCAPTIAADVPLDHPLWKHEMFLPITMVHKVETLDEAMLLANRVNYGLTAGFYGHPDETSWFFENIQAGVAYANRPQGATTGAWPGFQPFGGWKGSGSTGKNAGGHYYLPLYMREQIQTLID